MGKHVAISTPGEPVLSSGWIVGTVGAILGLLVAFGVNLTEGQLHALLVLVGFLAPVIAAVLARGKVIPQENVAAVWTKDNELVAGPAAVYPDGTPVEVWNISSLPAETT